jgi:thioredoxin 1
MSFTPSTINKLIDYSKSNPLKLIVLDFKAIWCNPCKNIKPFIDYLKEHYNNVEFYEIDIEDEETETITNTFEIKKLPTFIYYKNGNMCASLNGINKDNIEELVNEYL